METEELLLTSLRHRQVIFADETKVRVRGGTGYVWAFSGGSKKWSTGLPRPVTARFFEEVLDGFRESLFLISTVDTTQPRVSSRSASST